MIRAATTGLLLLLVLACAAGAPNPGEMRVTVPIRQIPPGAVLRSGDLHDIALPQDLVPTTRVVVDRGLLVGRRATETLLKHELVREERLGPPTGATPDPAYGVTQPGTPAPRGDLVMVIVSARQLEPGHLIVEDDLYAVQVEPKYLPEGVFLSPEHVVGRRPCDTILQDEFIRAPRLEDPDRPCLQDTP